MSELKELWGAIRSNAALEILTHSQISAAIKGQSENTLSVLKRKVKWRLLFCIIITIVFGVLIPLSGVAPIQVLLLILMSTYMICSVLIYQEFRLMKDDLEMDNNLLGTLINCRERILRFIQIEEIVSLIIYPISASAGFLLGMYLYDPQTQLLNEPKDWLLLIVPLFVFIPLSHWINKRLNKIAFGSQIEALTDAINELETGS